MTFNKEKLFRIFISLGLILLFQITINKKSNVALGCTSISLLVRSNKVFGRNLDVDSDMGNIFINPHGINKTAYFSSTCQETPAKWTSKYGSITFNQISKDIPHGGMNEAGLVVEHLFLGETQYEPKDSRPALISHQWVQYMLDNCKDVAEITEVAQTIRISASDYKFPIHFHVMDKSGDRAIIEFLNGEMIIFRKESYIIGVLANSTYKNSLNKSKEYSNLKKQNVLPTDISNSIERFIKASELVESYNENNSSDIISYSFSILDSVKNSTKWQIVYDLENLEIHYRTESVTKIRTLSMVDFSFNESKTISINDDSDLAANWLLFSTEINRTLIHDICDQSEFINSILGNEKEEIANYPY
ncbi:MAG: hypothetical protein C0597_06995 [Marinilabiliales bacterium]|nr:MAG: hypothetical protein C0597_06995 [Marinilabiliales bacterium]